MKYFKIILVLLTVFLYSIKIEAQVGIGTTVPDGALDITSTTDGLLIPRVALTITTSALPLTSPTVSELVYNTATVADVTTGYYYWNGTIWVRLAAGITTDWGVLGNTGIVDGTNFIGTAALTNVDVAFRRNNLPSGKIGLTSTSFGVGALNAGATTNSSAFGTNALTLNTGANNVGIGNNSLAANTTGTLNTSVGNSALAANTTGGNNIAIGSGTLVVNTTGATNVAIGNSTLAANVTGIQNTGIGHNALLFNTGSASTAIGFETLRANTSGNNGTAVGFRALSRNTSASNNTAIGFETMLNNTTGNENTAVGFQTSSIGATGSKNTAVGYIALNNNIGSENTAFGHSALVGITQAASRFNTAIGYQAMFATGLAPFVATTNVVAIGANALFQNRASNATAIGYNALQGQIAGGTGNTGVGYSVLNNNANGDNNTAVGNEAGFAATGSDNTLIGNFAGQFTSGSNNIAIGSNSLRANGASTNSVAIGFNALTINTATSNTAIGYNALRTNGTGTGNVAIGNQAGELETGSNKLYITNSNTTPTTSLIYGEFSPTRILRTNSTFQIGDPAATGYVFPTARGSVNEILQTNASGVLSWVVPTSLTVTETDPQVSLATNNRIPKWNGTTLVDGIVTDNGTSVTIAGSTSTTNLQMTAGATANYFLQSDASGNGSWAPIPVNTVKPYLTTGVLTGVYNVSLTEYTVRVFNGVSEVRLPDAAGNTGKIFIVIGSNTITSKIFSTAGGLIYDDVSNTFISTLNPNERYMVQSDGIDWIVIGR
jgi:trimeric autotransporter adhesin